MLLHWVRLQLVAVGQLICCAVLIDDTTKTGINALRSSLLLLMCAKGIAGNRGFILYVLSDDITHLRALKPRCQLAYNPEKKHPVKSKMMSEQIKWQHASLEILCLTYEEEREAEYRKDPVIQLKQVMAEDEQPLGPFCHFDVSLLNLKALLRGVETPKLGQMKA